MHAGRLTEAQHDWPLLDRRLRTLPGVGAWTGAEVRLALGDPDAVSVGDYNLPALVGHVLGDQAHQDRGDAGMLELLAPFAGQRARVIRLIEIAVPTGWSAGRGGGLPVPPCHATGTGELRRDSARYPGRR